MNAVNSNTIQIIGADGAIATLKRPIDSEFADVSGDLIPTKKSSEIGNLNMGEPEKMTEIYPVPEKVVGLVIGKGGSEIRNIQQISGCRVQMDPDSASENGVRNCTLEGSPEQVSLARQLITQVINRNQVGAPQGTVAGELTEEMLIPADKIGLVIGKGGDTIRTIQEQSGLRNCNVVQETTSATGQPKPLRMVGMPAAIEVAKALVRNIIMNNQQGNVHMAPRGHSGQEAKGEVIVPRLSAGMIIGKGGEMIKRLAAETGTKIQFKPDTNPNSEDRTAVIMGTREQIFHATEKITEIVNRAIKNNGAPSGGGAPSVGANPGQNVFYLHVPANKCGLVIGKGGENVKQIERDTGASCGLAPASEQKNDDEKVFEIKGTAYQIHHASHLVKIKVGEIAPNTPVPPLQGYQPASQQFGGMQTGASFQQAFVQQPQQQPQYNIPQQWSQNSVAPQHHQAVQPQIAPVQQVSQPADNAPTVNPATGAPDYSAQWAAYYRSIGLVDQAAMVENQMRRNQAAAAAPNGGGAPQQYYQQ